MVKIYADGADIEEMHAMARNKVVKGFTTNPTLCRKAGVKNYRGFAERAIRSFPDYPISFEVFSDDLDGMYAQGIEIDSWGDNVFVKVPVCNTEGMSTEKVIRALAAQGVKVNVTAVMCHQQIDEVYSALTDTPAIISIFAGRIADTGRSPIGAILYAVKHKQSSLHEVLWASPRQVLDVYTADSLGADIITCTAEIIKKLKLEGKNLIEYSRETSKMFFDDAQQAGYKI